MEKHREAYREEAHELLSELEGALLELEETPEDAELIGRVFRSLHTIKGSGAMFGFDDIAAFTHEVETVYDLVRDDQIPVTRDLVSLSLAACDHIRKMVAGKETDDVLGEKLLASFQSMQPPPEAEKPPVERGAEVPAGSEEQTTYRIGFRPFPNLLATGANPMLLLEELRELGVCRVVAHTREIPSLDELHPESCYFHWDVILTTDKGIDAIRDVFIFVEDACDLAIVVIDEGNGLAPSDYKRLGDILLERGAVSEETLRRALGTQKRLGEMLLAEQAVDPETLRSALVEQEHVRTMDRSRQESASASSVRVAAEKLDVMVDLVGELVTIQANLSRKASLVNDPELLNIAEEVERLTAELRDNTMSIRMLPIGTTFRKFKRLVRDLAQELGKEVVLTTAGGETELDKTVIEQLNDPLIHIIRNAVDHGIEPPQVREAIGKHRQGTVHLTAEHSGANVLIRISSDGAGLDTEAILARAVERGLIAPDAELTEKEIHALLFMPGFTTAKRVTDVSGRGVGMDVVKRRIEGLQGTIDIESKRGLGTTITLNLPLTLAIIDGLLVKIGPDHFVLPLSVVEECVELTRKQADKAHERDMMTYRENPTLYISLRALFGIAEDPPPMERVVISEVKGEKVGFGLDQVIGQHQTVIKPIGKIYKDIKGVSGATILGDGTVALILDIHQLLTAVEEVRSRRASPPRRREETAAIREAVGAESG